MKEIPEDQILLRLELENSWWKSNALPDACNALKPRPYLELFYPLLGQIEKIRRAVVLLGPRRVGKTVLIQHAIGRLIKEGIPPKQIGYFSVDHPLYNGLRLEELMKYYAKASGTDYKSLPTYLFFDEIQYHRNWETHLKSIVDTYSNVRPIVSGSAAAALRLKSLESGAGRFTDFLLPPLTFHEYLALLSTTNQPVPEMEGTPGGFFHAKDIDKLNEAFLHYLNYGGYPEVVLSKEIQSDPARFIKSDIIDKVLLRDLPSLYGIQDIQELNHLFTTLAFNTANEVSLESLSQGSGVAKNTLKRYTEYLEAAFLIQRVQRVDMAVRRFKRANFFKVYLTNPSIRSALFSPVKADDQEMGYLVETAIFSQWFHTETTPIHYARWQGGEVDLVYLDAKQKVLWALEAKWSDEVCDRIGTQLKNALDFCHKHNLKKITVTTRTKRRIETVKNVQFEMVPASEYCYTVGRNLIENRQRMVNEIMAMGNA